jgi:hypothetical protein
MGNGSAEVPAWSKLGLQWDEFEVLVREIDASPAFLEAYGGDTSYPCPTPSVRYDIESVLYVSSPVDGTLASALDPGEQRPDFQRLVDDFYACALETLRSLTKPDDFIFALDCEYEGYRFWPHRAVADEPWPLRVPGPEAYYSLYAPPEYTWGFFVGWAHVEVFGQPLLDAFEQHKPEILSKVTARDGVELPAPPLTELEQKRVEQQLAQDRVDRILFVTELNYNICPKGPWTPELERLHAEFQRTRDRADLAKLIAWIERVLDELGIDHSPCVRFADQDDS